MIKITKNEVFKRNIYLTKDGVEYRLIISGERTVDAIEEKTKTRYGSYWRKLGSKSVNRVLGIHKEVLIYKFGIGENRVAVSNAI